jgi:fibro-slime domain-containing protein
MSSLLRNACLGLGVLLLVASAACGGNPQIAEGNNDISNATDASTDAANGGGSSLQLNLHSDAGASGDSNCDGGDCSDSAATALCGDSVIESPEQCDDGNTTAGDGCSGVCTIEPGYTCPSAGQSCIYTVKMVCGDGKIEGTEACDDGNATSGDGCSSTCTVEAGFTCGMGGEPCVQSKTAGVCGDGAVDSGEQCDDGNAVDGDGCSAKCQLESGYACSNPGQPCAKLEYCGDGIIESDLLETCDDGNAVPGDGCSGTCSIEPGFACLDQGKPCVSIWVCGNGRVDPGEACDDGNTVSEDGCSADCSTVEAGFSCPSTGGPCAQALQAVCGDGIRSPSEACDDGNTVSKDGCSGDCSSVDPGYTCPTPGKLCTKIAYCGDGVVSASLGETCDDGNTVAGDGCSPLCLIEANFKCPPTGGTCTSTVVCGDGVIAGAETCDDGNTTAGDGCSATCTVESGWQCPAANIKCVAAKCGDGIVAGYEQCDDGNVTSNDGCSSTCKRETGYACLTTAGKSACHKTTCGDGVLEGSEECDDKNLIPYDGCSPSCTIEATCANGSCTNQCGDGFLRAPEACDDGNTFPGDGCSATCTVEKGFSCTSSVIAPPTTLNIPILYRDFLYASTDSSIGPAHADFEYYHGDSASLGLVQSALGSDGLPVFANLIGQAGGYTASQQLTSAQWFYWWHHEQDCRSGTCVKNQYEKLVYLDQKNAPTVLPLTRQSDGSYLFSTSAFFPIDNLGWVGSNGMSLQTTNGHNFSFTSELRYQFTYLASQSPAAVLNFTGDDDVWVFINGVLAVDIGGLHPATNGNITLNATAATKLGLVDKGMYEIALFQAERHTTGSNYALTLDGFEHDISVCTTKCGDGIVAGSEVCDDGVNNNSYGSCKSDCSGRAAYCGDGTVNTPEEACDTGATVVTYGGTTQQCGPGCEFAPYCGDAIINGPESCDDGASLNGSGYGHCGANCAPGPRCGDGVINGPEACDDGINNGSTESACATNCTLKCGNGVVDFGEQCDNGTSANTGGYGKCDANCTLGPRCGDGIKNGSEQCDDGKNDGSYGSCNSDCTIANYCGDGKLTAPPEVCDLGSQDSATAYGRNMCTTHCTPAPFCGDKSVDVSFGEVCDDGVDNGQPGSCTSDCKQFVTLATCGNGKLDSGEACDDGAKNGTTGDKCDAHCRLTCGNGFKDPGEQCDNGVNDGSYGTCNADCTLAPHCGDDVKNGPEQCDFGSQDVSYATAYGPGICTSLCTFAPFCGDGRVQTAHGEQCDGSSNCTSSCSLFMAK